MKSMVTSGILGVGLGALFLLSGCVSKAELDKCVRRNQIQLERIQALEEGQESERLRADRLKQEYDLMQQQQPYWSKKLETLQAQLDAKNALIQQLSEQMGNVPLPPELNTALQDWARQAGPDVVEFDEKSGIVRFKSDLLFEKGEDKVQQEFQPRLEQLAQILQSPTAQGFDALIVGHTDDIPIEKPSTLAQHPTNWHLSAHRAIAVEKILAASGLVPTRIAVMGMGQYRPIVPNAPGNKGNPQNRRVEIYIVPAGQIRPIPTIPAEGAAT
ncbi:MAG: OmpA family protein [Sedimentisphaerales bacterium]|nr:OmpA family protein [Sedimentisphaerales bacterium]